MFRGAQECDLAADECAFTIEKKYTNSHRPSDRLWLLPMTLSRLSRTPNSVSALETRLRVGAFRSFGVGAAIETDSIIGLLWDGD
jgi:hypothetical protein